MPEPEEWVPKRFSREFEDLKRIAPSIAFSVTWEIDPYFRWDGDGPDPRGEGYEPHDVDVRARAIVGGEVVEGFASLGGVYEKLGEFDPDIHGYLLEMLDEAVDDLSKEVSGRLLTEAKAARRYLKKAMHARYEAQQRRSAL